MKRKFFFELSLIFLLVSFGLVSGVTTSGSFQVNTGGDKVLISTTCQESWTAFWNSCNNGIQTYVCVDSNNCNTINTRPVNCDMTQACTVPLSTPNGGGGGGGGGGGSGSSSTTTIITTTPLNNSVCIESWSCTLWSNFNSNCGTRTCNDKNNCGTILLKPAIEKTCPGITGGIIGFAQTTPGIMSIAFIAFVLLFVVITLSRKKTKAIANNEQVQQKSKEKPAKNKSAE